MKKLLITVVGLLLSSVISMGTNWVGIESPDPAPAQAKLEYSTIDRTVINVYIPGFQKSPVKTPNGNEYIISLNKTTPVLKKGAPDLPKLTASVIIPDMAGMEVKVLSSKYKEYHGQEIAPSKGSFSRNIDPSDVPYIYGEEYNKNEYFPGDITGLRDPHIIRDHRGQTIIVYPFQYNPVSKTLRVYYEIKLEIYQVNNDGKNKLIRKEEPFSVVDEFGKIYEQYFLNYNNIRYTPLDEQGDMLIISYGEFIETMQPFVEWKNTIGINTEIVDVATIGTNSLAIKNYIEDYYFENDLAFVLLAGDADQVPTSNSNGHSDNNYGYIIGNDHYPDLFVGRFSAETIDEVEIQVERTVNYEKNPYMETDWFSKGIGVASDLGPGDDNEYDYEHIRNMQTDFLNFTYTYCSELYDGTQGGEDEPGNPNPAMVSSKINEGASTINYAGHGSTVSWGSSGYSVSHVEALTNTGMHPFIWAAACKNGNFVYNTCFAESWLRAEHNGEPTGAIAVLMSTNNQDWNPPMCGQDEMADILVESYENNIKRTFGGISMNGCMQMNDEYGTVGEATTDTWTCFGDPSVMVRTAMPQEISANYNSPIFIGSTQLSVSTDTEDGTVCLNLNGEIISTAYIEGGIATLEFDELIQADTLKIAITSFNHLPLLDEIPVIPPDGPYIITNTYEIDDSEGNNNGMADYGEHIKISLGLENIGVEDASDVQVSISTNDEYFTITDSSEIYPLIPVNEIITVENGFSMDIAENVPDNHSAMINVKASMQDKATWKSSFTITAHAAVIKYKDYVIDDSEGNNNGLFDPGETVSLKISIENQGSAVGYDISGILSTGFSIVSIEDDERNYGNIVSSGVSERSFTVSCEDYVPKGTSVSFSFDYYMCDELIESEVLTIPIHQPQIIIYDLDKTATSGTTIYELLTDMNLSSDYCTTLDEAVGDNFNIAFVCLGIYNNNYILSYNEGQKLADFLDDEGYLYMEGGDTWHYNPKTPVHSMFNINGYDDGNNDLDQINGISGTFTENLTFQYTGENKYIDRIESVNSGFDILENEPADYVCAIANEGQSYKTIGSSFEFGGLSDGQYKKAELLGKYLEFFELNIPDKPSIPIGPDKVCSNDTETSYYIPSLEGIENYCWYMVPNTAGEINANDTSVTVIWNEEYTDDVILQVCGIGDESIGEMSDPLEIKRFQSPKITLGADTSICCNHLLTLSPGEDFESYLWMDGSTLHSLVVDSSGVGLGNKEVWVEVTDENGCTGKAEITITFIECAGINENFEDKGITIYPNPSDGIIYINFSNDQIHPVKLSVYNSLGHIVKSLSLSGLNNNYSIDLGHLREGIYFISLATNTGIFNRKVVIR